MAGDVVVGAAKQSPRLRLRPRLRKARPLQRSLQGPAKVVRLSADSVDTKGKLSNLVTQGKAAANKLAKVVAGEQTANPEELGFEEQGCLLPAVRDKRMETLASWESDRSGRAWATKEKVLEKESASASSKVEKALSRLCLSFTCFFLGEGIGGVD